MWVRCASQSFQGLSSGPPPASQTHFHCVLLSDKPSSTRPDKNIRHSLRGKERLCVKYVGTYYSQLCCQRCLNSPFTAGRCSSENIHHRQQRGSVRLQPVCISPRARNAYMRSFITSRTHTQHMKDEEQLAKSANSLAECIMFLFRKALRVLKITRGGKVGETV